MRPHPLSTLCVLPGAGQGWAMALLLPGDCSDGSWYEAVQNRDPAGILELLLVGVSEADKKPYALLQPVKKSSQ